MLTFSFWPQHCQTINMVQGIGCISKHTQRNWHFPSPNKTVVVPQRSVSSPQNLSTIGCDASIIALIEPTPLSNLTTENNFDTWFMISLWKSKVHYILRKYIKRSDKYPMTLSMWQITFSRTSANIGFEVNLENSLP